MNRLKHFLLLLTIMLLSACAHPWGVDQLRYIFTFENNSDKDIYIVIDTNPSDSIISAESRCVHICAGEKRYVESKIPWYDIIIDSACIYVVDASLINLPAYLTLDECEAISQDMVLDQITVYHDDFLKKHPISYPY